MSWLQETRAYRLGVLSLDWKKRMSQRSPMLAGSTRLCKLSKRTREAWEPCGVRVTRLRTRRHALRSGYSTSIHPDSSTQRTTATTPSSSLCLPHSIASHHPQLYLSVYTLSFFLNLCRPPFSTSSRPKEQSLGSHSTAPGYPFSTSRRRSSSRTTSEKPTTLTSSFTIPPIRVRLSIRAASDHDALLLLLPSRVCNTCCSRIFTNPASEYKDDSQIVPRSTSVIVKRRPAVRPGKGRAAMYISGTPSASSEKHTPIVTPANNTWHRPGLPSGHTSKRFDSREKERDRDEPQKPVRVTYRFL